MLRGSESRSLSSAIPAGAAAARAGPSRARRRVLRVPQLFFSKKMCEAMHLVVEIFLKR